MRHCIVLAQCTVSYKLFCSSSYLSVDWILLIVHSGLAIILWLIDGLLIHWLAVDVIDNGLLSIGLLHSISWRSDNTSHDDCRLLLEQVTSTTTNAEEDRTDAAD